MWLSKEEILSWSLMGVKGLTPMSDQERISPYNIKQIPVSDGNKKYIN